MVDKDLLLDLYRHMEWGQINARLREIGGEPPLVDYIAWIWLGRPTVNWPSIRPDPPN